MTDRAQLSSAPNDVDLQALWQALWQAKLVIALCALVLAASAAIYAFTATPLFKAEVVVAHAAESGLGGATSMVGTLGGLASLAGISFTGSGRQSENKAVLGSRNLAQEFVSRRNLLRVLLPKARKPTLWFAVERFRGDVVKVREDERNGVITVTMTWVDPAIAAAWANEYIALANDLIRTRALENSQKNIAYLNEQIALTDVVERQRALYNIVESETKTAMLASAREDYAFAVVDRAVPPEVKSHPRRMLLTFAGGVAGGFFGILFVLARNLTHRSRTAVRVTG